MRHSLFLPGRHGSFANGLFAGVIAPLVMHSTRGLAVALMQVKSIGAAAWYWVKPRVTGAAAQTLN